MVCPYYPLLCKLLTPCEHRDDAYPHHAFFKWSKCSRAKTFVDALVLLSHKPNTSTPWNHLVHFPRPALDVRNLVEGLSRVSVGSSQAALPRQATPSQAVLPSGSSTAIPDASPPSYTERNTLGLSFPSQTDSQVLGMCLIFHF